MALTYYRIEQGIEPPKPRGVNCGRPPSKLTLMLAKMNIGESFVEPRRREQLAPQITLWARARGKTFATLPIKGGTRIWRTK